MKLTKEQILGIVRHTLTFIGGIVIARGLVDETLILQTEFSEFIGVNFLGEEDNGFWINDNLRILFFFDN